MNEIIHEYGGMAISAIATICLLTMMLLLLFSRGGVLARMVFLWGNGGC